MKRKVLTAIAAASVLLTGATTSIGQQVEVFAASTSRYIDTAFASLAQQPVGALLVSPDTLFDNRRAHLVTLAARHGFSGSTLAATSIEL